VSRSGARAASGLVWRPHPPPSGREARFLVGYAFGADCRPAGCEGNQPGHRPGRNRGMQIESPPDRVCVHRAHAGARRACSVLLVEVHDEAISPQAEHRFAGRMAPHQPARSFRRHSTWPSPLLVPAAVPTVIQSVARSKRLARGQHAGRFRATRLHDDGVAATSSFPFLA
jgi:hypothetical protein